MAQVLDIATGTVIDVPDVDVSAGVSSGRFALPKGRVEVRNKLGQRGSIDAADASRAFADGFSYVPPTEVEDERLEAEYGDRDAAAFGAGLARGATLGLSDKLAVETGFTTPEALSELEKRNEGASMAGEVVGSVAPALIPGGQATAAGAVARGAARVGARLGSGAVSRAAVTGAVEGGAYGLGNLISEEAMGRTDLTGEKVAAEVAINALLGGVGGGLLGKLEAKLTRKAAGQADEVADVLARPGSGDSAGGGTGPTSTMGDAVPPPTGGAPEIPPPGGRGGPASTPDASPPTSPAPDALGVPDAPGGAPAGTGPSPYTVSDGVNTYTFNPGGAADMPPGGVPRDAPPGAGGVADPPPSAGGAGAGTPPPGGSGAGGGGATPPGGGGFDPMRAFDELIADDTLGARTRKTLEEAVERNQGRVGKLLTDLGLDFPTAETWVLRDLDFKKAANQRLREKGLDTSAPRALLEDARYAGAISSDAKVKLIQTKREEAGAVIGSSVKRFDEMAGPEDLLDAGAFASKVDAEILAPLRKGTVDERRTARRVKQEVDALLDRVKVDAPDAPPGTPPTFRRLSFSESEEYKRALDRSLKWDSTVPNMVRDELRKVRGIFNGQIEAGAAALSKRAKPEDAGVFSAWKDSKRLFGQMAELEEEASKRLLDAKDANRFLSLTDNLAGGAALAAGGLNPVGLAMSAGAAVFNKWGRERLPHLIALQMHRAGKGGPDSGAAAALYQAVRKTEDAASKAGGSEPFGPFTETVRRAAAKGEAELFAVHSVLSADDGYRETMQQAAGLDYRPEADAAGMARGQRLEEVRAASDAFDKKVESSLSAFLSKERRPSSRVPGEKAMAWAARVADLTTQPDRLAELLTTGTATLGKDAPATSAAVIQSAQRAVTFLSGKAPKQPTPALDVPSLRLPWKPTAAELSKFARYVAAVERPASVLDDMAAGAVTPEAVEALRNVYPALYADIRERVTQRLASHPGQLDYAQRLSLGLLLDLPTDSSLAPASIAAFQKLHAVPEPTAPARRAGPSGGKVFMDDAPESDRLAARRQ